MFGCLVVPILLGDTPVAYTFPNHKVAAIPIEQDWQTIGAWVVSQFDLAWSFVGGTPHSSRRSRGVTEAAPEFIRGRSASALQ